MDQNSPFPRSRKKLQKIKSKNRTKNQANWLLAVLGSLVSFLVYFLVKNVTWSKPKIELQPAPDFNQIMSEKFQIYERQFQEKLKRESELLNLKIEQANLEKSKLFNDFQEKEYKILKKTDTESAINMQRINAISEMVEKKLDERDKILTAKIEEVSLFGLKLLENFDTGNFSETVGKLEAKMADIYSEFQAEKLKIYEKVTELATQKVTVEKTVPVVVTDPVNSVNLVDISQILKIIPEATTETSSKLASPVKFLGLSFAKRYNAPNIVFQNSNHNAGQCWAAKHENLSKDSPVRLSFETFRNISISGFSIEYLENSSSSPKHVALLDFATQEKLGEIFLPETPKPKNLGFFGNSHSPPQNQDQKLLTFHQTNLLPFVSLNSFNQFTLEIYENFGNSDYTCLYQLKIFGKYVTQDNVEQIIAEHAFRLQNSGSRNLNNLEMENNSKNLFDLAKQKIFN